MEDENEELLLAAKDFDKLESSHLKVILLYTDDVLHHNYIIYNIQ